MITVNNLDNCPQRDAIQNTLFLQHHVISDTLPDTCLSIHVSDNRRSCWQNKVKTSLNVKINFNQMCSVGLSIHVWKCEVNNSFLLPAWERAAASRPEVSSCCHMIVWKVTGHNWKVCPFWSAGKRSGGVEYCSEPGHNSLETVSCFSRL